ncbi:MAG TPA: Omp28-related outer membrane protein [Chitinophagales bacterium]|nr:Omp28-related outer membrane protein [Chitinophagales bacterium]
MATKYWGVVAASMVYFLLQSCKEVGPEINLKNNQNAVSDTTYVESPQAAEVKNVILEEFTGVRCPNCPQGHQITAQIKAANPGRVISVSFHPVNSLGYHYPFSKDTFQNAVAQSLFDFMGQLGFEPVAAVDRLANGTSVLWDKNVWSSKTTAQLAQTTPVNLVLGKTYNPANRELTIVTELHYTQNVAEKNKLTVVLSESDIESAQLDGSVIDTFYIHKDVERAFITAVQGDVIDQPLDAGRVVVKVYKTTLAAKWKPENMHIVAYVHQYENAKQVYQAKELEVQ